MKRAFLFQCAIAMICAMWLWYAAEQQVQPAKQTDYFKRVAGQK